MTLQEVCQIITGLQLQTLLFFGLVTWWFTRNLRNELHQMHKDMGDAIEELKNEKKSQSARTDKLYEMFIDLVKQKNG